MESTEKSNPGEESNVSSSLGHVPASKKWEFDEQVTACFDDMLARSIPQYEVMRKACFELACRYQQPKTHIVDLGCSRGGAIAEVVCKFGAYNRYVGVDVSAPMLAAARERFKGMIDAGVVDIRECDLRTDYPPCMASVTLCVLTLQFTPIEYRPHILQRIYDHTVPGGALIIVEKLLGSNAHTDKMLVDLYYSMKSEHGYSQEEIQRKRLALEGVLVPMTAKANEDFLRDAGFRNIECFWRFFNFAGWVALK